VREQSGTGAREHGSAGEDDALRASSPAPPRSRAPAPPHSPGRTTTRKRWPFRVAAALAGLSLFPLAELACVAFGWGRPTQHDDPFVGFSAVHPLFVLSDDGERFEIARSRYKFFAPDSFAARKAPDEFRIFVLGGSTVQGRPYSTETSFPTWLELALREADDRHTWEVVNCGGISYAAYRLVPILQEVLRYEPDFIVICEGHNEFLEDRTYGHIKRVPGAIAGPQQWLSRRRLFVLLRGLVHPTTRDTASRDERPILAADADAMLNYHNGIAAYHRDDAWREGVVEHFAFNVRRMVEICRDAGVPVMLIKPPSNLADQPPFKSEHKVERNSFRSPAAHHGNESRPDHHERNAFRSTLPDDLERFDSLLAEAQSLYRTDLPAAITLLKQALAIDDQHAATWYELGKCHETTRDYASARHAFVRARDLDICPLRMITPLEHALEDIARNEAVPYLDAHRLLEERTPNGILGKLWLVDRCHPSFEGHQVIADAILEELSRLGLAAPRDGWREDAHAAYQRHFESLPNIYFARGEATLNSVSYWERGLADGPPAEDRFPHRIHP
jgi:lysophospholipase L1-like esterase